MSATFGCPACGKPVPVEPVSRPASFPFCSPRCRLLDLGAWCDGKYAIAGRPLAQDPDEDSDHL
ncbi:DNA gyrase inhibitor YacG [Planctomycetota bacterium]|nr:DNA gyrase inhibitor YacG [Planctomycetota bacterium]